MIALLDILSWALLLCGTFVCLAAGIGVNRLPDVYSRAHAAGMADTLGATLILLGLALQSGLSLVTVKLAIIAAFLFITSPTSSHALAKAAWLEGVRPKLADASSAPRRPSRASE